MASASTGRFSISWIVPVSLIVGVIVAINQDYVRSLDTASKIVMSLPVLASATRGGLCEVEAAAMPERSEFAAVNEGIYSAMRLVPCEDRWNHEVQRVIVILSSSRSGSSLLFNALSRSGDVVAPAGEHEPWLFLSGNKYPFTSSDWLRGPDIRNREILLHLMRNDLLVRQGSVPGEELGDLLWNRFAARRLCMSSSVIGILTSLYSTPIVDVNGYRLLIEAVSRACLGQRPVVRLEHITDGRYLLPIENPPYIDQPLARRATLEELALKPLLFKSPADSYRPEFYESLFPRARVTYVHLTRGFAQTVNGLMDGWSGNNIDYISNAVGMNGSPLAIAGYSAAGGKVSNVYWCFDLFPGWKDYRDASLFEVCTRQWLQAHTNILRNFSVGHQIMFESFHRAPNRFARDVQAMTGLQLAADHDWSEPVMTTERPRSFRWRKRESLFLNVETFASPALFTEVARLQAELGCSMDETTWH